MKVIGYIENWGAGKVMSWSPTGISGYEEQDGKKYNPKPTDLMRPWKHKEEKKTYKLSEMWKVWYQDDVGKYLWYSTPYFYHSLEDARKSSTPHERSRVLAITRADATEFYEGEGLENEDIV